MPQRTAPEQEQTYLRNVSAKKVAVTETIAIPAGAAGALVDFDVTTRPIASLSGADLGGVGNTSFILTSTAFITLVNFKDDADLANGEYYLDHLTGRGRGRKADTSTSGTAAFSVFALQTISHDSDDESAGADGASNTSNRSATSSRISGFNGTTWDRIRAGITTISSTLTGFLNTLPWGIYHAAPSTRTEGQGGPVETDEKGNTRIVEQKKPGAEYNSEKYIAVSQKYVNTTTNKPVSTVNLSFQTATIASSAILLVGARIVNTAASARFLFLNNATSIAGAAAPTIPPVQIPANSTITLTPEELGGAGYRFDTAFTVGNSSTPSTFTAATAGDLLIQLFTTTATS